MSTVSVFVRIQLSAEGAPAYAEAAKAVVAATREEDGCEWYGIASDVTGTPAWSGFLSSGPLRRTSMRA
ncbi:MAG: hypothetical protein ACJ0Q1_07805 [Luminiphilus sp.]